GIEHLTMMIDGLQNVLGFSGNLGLNKNLLPRKSFYGAAQPFERAITLGAIIEGDSMVVGVMDEPVKPFLPERVLHVPTVAAGSETQSTQLQTGIAQHNLICSCALCNCRRGN